MSPDMVNHGLVMTKADWEAVGIIVGCIIYGIYSVYYADECEIHDRPFPPHFVIIPLVFICGMVLCNR